MANRLRLASACVWVLLGSACGGTPKPEVADQLIDLLQDIEMASFIPQAPATQGTTDRAVIPPALEFSDAARIVRIRTSGTLVAPIDLSSGSAVLEFDIRFRGSTENEIGELAVSLLGTDGRQLRLGTVTNQGQKWSATRVSLAGAPGQRQFLVLHSTLPDEAVSLEIRAPRLRLPSSEPRAEATIPTRILPPEPLPNILLIVLDAARAGNFGAYGYSRNTTPAIDGLAAEELVFSRAFSECPNTSCSVPNLISGTQFVKVGPVGDWHRLDDRMITLAEYLRRVGYRTIALSASPNNGKARNSHQGFDEFHELWLWPGHRRNHPQRIDPHRLTRLALEALEKEKPATPVFMALHYIPPHEPYEPKPEFDLFGDPAYEGPIRPGTMFRGRLERPADPADLARMTSLYDGNLRMADDAVGELFDGWRRLGRWNDALVLVTSDHGETFFEHGRQGHNATLYNEMLHVPFILRLPGRHVPSDVKRDRLVILSDVVPTILGQVGLVPDAAVGGVDLLRAADASEHRVIFHRHTDGRQFAVHTRKWKAILAPGSARASMLFDLENDPGETVNIVEDRPLVFHGLAALLRRHILASQRLNLDGSQVELPEADIRALRSLGYLR